MHPKLVQTNLVSFNELQIKAPKCRSIRCMKLLMMPKMKTIQD